MKKIFYIGNVPPPYGGVTVRNFIYITELKKYFKLNLFEFKHSEYFMKYLELIKIIFFSYVNLKNNGVICLDTRSLIYVTKVLNIFNPKIMKNIAVITSGGIEDKEIISSGININILNKYKQFFVEIETLKNNLEKIGLKNIKILPNCRNKPYNRMFVKTNDKTVKFISISRICKEKGILKIIEAEKLLSSNLDFTIDFYGPIDDEIKDEYLKGIDSSDRMEDKSLFEGDKYSINDLLKEYDVLLLPSDHAGEGYPGVIADSKIAGTTIISSNINDNSKLIKDREDGVILEQNTPQKLAESMRTLIEDSEYLYRLRKASYDSAEYVFIENYIQMLIEEKS